MDKKIDRAIIGASAMAAACMMFGIAITANAEIADTELPKEYIYYCEEAGQVYDICPEMIQAIIEQESDGNPGAVGAAGEIGLMQIYPRYHVERSQRLNVYDLFEPEGNILVGADYLAELFAEYQDMGTVLMIYNGVEDAKLRGNNGDYTDYAEEIMQRVEELERLHGK